VAGLDPIAVTIRRDEAITGEAPPKAADRAFDDPFVPAADRQELTAVFTADFLHALDRALECRPAERWQDADAWKTALENPTQERVPGRQTVMPQKTSDNRTPSKSSIPRPGQERDFLLTDEMSIRMCWIPPGEFLMGSREDEFVRSADETQHRVRISSGFWMAKYPVTQAQWRAVMGSRPSACGAPGFLSGWFGNPEKDTSWRDLPVERVSWNDIAGPGGFIEKVNQTAAATGGRFHLPTEAQWEYACRAGTTGPYAGDLEQMAWYDRNSGEKTHPVGRKKPNAWGLHDMHGNVWEWCADWYGAYPEGAASDPSGPVSGTNRVGRGGSWDYRAISCRSANRGNGNPGFTSNNIGFRPARTPSP